MSRLRLFFNRLQPNKKCETISQCPIEIPKVYCCINNICSVYENSQLCIDAGGIVLSDVPSLFDVKLDDTIVPENPINPPASHWIDKKIIPLELREDELELNTGILVTTNMNLVHVLNGKPGLDLSFGDWEPVNNNLIYLDSDTNKYYLAVVQNNSLGVTIYGILEIVIADDNIGGECDPSSDEQCWSTPTSTVLAFYYP